jgi:uncharacterized protein YdeI (YjbR/CyaY-like superfamily)
MPRFFSSPSEWRAWLADNHQALDELWVGFHKRGSGRPSITWPESVDQALCFGWIDGRRQSIDSERYKIRFTPRRARSHWSAVNVARFRELEAAGLVAEAGRRAFSARSEERTAQASYERTEEARLDASGERLLRANSRASAFFLAQAPWYQRAAIHWVISAKREETRRRRLERLIEDSAAGRTVPPLTRPG